MQNEKYWRSKIPVSLVLLFLLNVFLIIAMEVLLIYRFPAEITPENLAARDAIYEDCTILSSDAINHLNCNLVQTNTGEYRIAAYKNHALFHSRAKLLSDESVVPPENGELSVPVKNGVRTCEVIIQPDMTLVIRYAASQSGATVYMVIAAILEAAELLIWEFIKRNLR